MARKKSALSGPIRKVLDKFDRKPVYETSIAIRNAGDGLSKAMAVDPVILHSGDTVYVVLECTVTNIVMVPSADDGGEWYTRQQVLVAGDAAIVDKDLVVETIQTQRARIEEANGIMRFEFPEGDEGLLVAEFFATLDEALDAGTIFRDVDPAKGKELVAGLVDAGWTSPLDDETGGIRMTAPDGRSFVLKIADAVDDETTTDEPAEDGKVTPIGRGRGAKAADGES